MKRITVAVTLSNPNYYDPKRLKAAMVNAAVAKATEQDAEIHSIETKIGNVRR